MNMEEFAQSIDDNRGHKGKWKPVELEAVQRKEGLEPCWLIINRATNNWGYVPIKMFGKQTKLHAAAVELATGKPIPKGMTASHLCELLNDRDSRRCVNPSHIVIESWQDNSKRSPTIMSRAKTLNTYRWPKKDSDDKEQKMIEAYEEYNKMMFE